MSVTTRNPLRTAGATLHSGSVNTGQQNMTYGGGQAICVLSGALLLGSGGSTPVAGGTTGHAVFWSGPGRLDTVLAHQAISGTAIFFYDSNVVARSGVATIGESGYRIVGVVPANTIGSYVTLGGGPLPLQFGTPFQNGLAVSCPSGAPGFTASFTPEVNPSI